LSQKLLNNWVQRRLRKLLSNMITEEKVRLAAMSLRVQAEINITISSLMRFSTANRTSGFAILSVQNTLSSSLSRRRLGFGSRRPSISASE